MVGPRSVSALWEKASSRTNQKDDDVSDRFKYKVNALMGVFDPPNEKDNEHNHGHITAAMLKFPCNYTFHVVGKTRALFVPEENDTTTTTTSLTSQLPSPHDFAEQAKEIVLQYTSNRQEDRDSLVVSIVPRGTKFTKLSIEAYIETPESISYIYQAFQKNLTGCVMRF